MTASVVDAGERDDGALGGASSSRGFVTRRPELALWEAGMMSRETEDAPLPDALTVAGGTPKHA
ncbi:MAG: hypothetical protein DRJ42_09600 [Deltaproteobacteria bacterium]|nr:MAG: hypothetical protein DRJ42_09600 [Deltaproteobacteria bacterium]